MMNPYGYLTNYSNAVTPPLLDLILQNETGHLSQKDRWNPYKSKSSAGAIGGYQLMPQYLHDYGYGMDPYIQADAVNPEKSREIAGKLIKGYSGHYGFTNLADTLIGYNMGAKKTSDWIKRGRNIEELPDETKAYLKRAKNYIDQYSQDQSTDG
jgi:soluble lytic murein transglycosylase-like protein